MLPPGHASSLMDQTESDASDLQGFVAGLLCSAGQCWRALHIMVLGIGYLVAALSLAVGSVQAQADHSYPVLWSTSTIATTNVDYADGSTQLRGYLAYQNSSSAARPTVIVYPDWDGISNYERFRAHLLANMGYTAFVADVFSTAYTQGPSLPYSTRSALMTMFKNDTAMWRTRLQAALQIVRTLPTVQADKLFAIGYCFGGAGVLELFRSWPATPGLLGVGGFHAGPLTTNGTKAKLGNPLRAAVYNGADDPGIQPEAARALKAELEAANATWSYYAYGRTVHAFTLMENPLWNGDRSMSGAYNPTSDRASWWALRGLLLEVFGLIDVSNPYTATGDTFDSQTGIAGMNTSAL